MSIIEKLSMMGIRSFGPDDHNRQVIEFFHPLTLILGPNGSGKTTIIECLRYMTTGDTPPNSDRGSSFVHDPKIAGETEVKGQVKLQFRDMANKRIVAARNLVATQKQKRIQLKTLEGTITRCGVDGEKTSLSSRCAEIDKEMITALGVSKPILNHVIFCHQEESNWPLSEGKALKQKFDDIFAATRYIKALEEIRKIRAEKMKELSVYKTDVTHLKENKRKAQEFSSDLEKTETRLTACKRSIENVETKLKPITEKLTEISQKEFKISKLQSESESNKKILERCESDQRMLRDNIKNLFSGSKGELAREMNNFNKLVAQKKSQQDKVKRKCSEIEAKQKNLMKTKSRLIEELGRLKAEHKQHEDRIERRDKYVNELSVQLGFGELSHDSDDPTRETQSVIRNWRQKINTSQHELENTKASFESKENEFQSNIDEVRDKVSQKTQQRKSSEEKIHKNKITIRNIEAELSEATTLAARQDDLRQDIRDTEAELTNLQNRVNVVDLRHKVAQCLRKKKEKESKLSNLNLEMNELQKESELRTEIDLINRDKSMKEETRDKLMTNHKETVQHLIGQMPARNAQDSVKKHIGFLNREVNGVTKDLDTKRAQLSSQKTSKRFHLEELKKVENTLTSHKNKIAEVCGSQDFDEGYDLLEKTVKELQDEKGALTGSLYLYNKYIEKLSTPKPCCPLCTRAFQQDKEAKSLKQDLQKKLQEVPNQLSRKEKLLAEHQKRLNSMLELRPLRQEVINISENEIPNLKEKIEDVSQSIETLIEEISHMEESLESKQCDLKAASDILPDLAMLDQCQRELERLERRLSSLSCQLGSSDMTRTIQQVGDEILAFKQEIESLTKEMESNQSRITEHGESVQRLKGQLNDLKAEQVEIAGRLQKKNSLEEQLKTLTTENLALAEIVKEVKIEIVKLEKEVSELLKEKQKVLKSKEQELEKIRNKINMEKKKMENVDKLTEDIERYINEGREERLADHEQKIVSVNEDVEQNNRELSKLNTEEKALGEEIASQQTQYREYEDNKRLMDLEEEVTSFQQKQQKLDRDLGGYDVRTLLSEKRRLLEQEKQLTKERNENEGRQAELMKQVVDLKNQLKDKIYRNAEKEHRDKLIQLRTTELACEDLSKYYAALDRAIMKYHQMKMDEINKIVRDLWIKTYSGSDIDYIEIRSSEDENDAGLERARRVYNYKVVLVKGDTAVDMRGRCSAGQKVLASLLIRLALAEVFCLNCGILALDEPTTNLDRENICSLARALVEIVQSRSEQRNFQLIIITHDEDFIELLGRSETVDYFYKVSKDSRGCSKLNKCCISEMA